MFDELSQVLAIRFDFGRLATDIPRLEIQYVTTSSQTSLWQISHFLVVLPITHRVTTSVI